MTTAFNAVFGVTPGYSFQDPLNDEDAFAKVAGHWQHEMEAYHKEYGILVTAVLKAAKVSYPAEFGCPSGGEFVVEITGVRNPEFCPQAQDMEWRLAVNVLVRRMQVLLKQSRVTMYFNTAQELHYMKLDI